MRILITGINGMAGSLLAESYLNDNYNEVHGTIRPSSNLQFIKPILDKITLHMTDLTDAHGILDIMKNGFDIVHATASITFVPYSWANPSHTLDVIAKGTTNLLEGIRRTEGSNHTIYHGFGSSEMYGIVRPEDTPLKETHPLNAHSPYGTAKCMAEMQARQYHITYGMKTVLTRAFNHENERRGRAFIGPTVIRQAIQIAEGKRKAFSLGNLDAVRDLLDARDVVMGYRLAIGMCDYGEPYNISSMNGTSVRSIVERVKEIVGLSKDIEINVDPKRVRPTDIPVLIGDSSKFRAKTGWAPTYDYLKDTLPSIYEAFKTWRHSEVYDN